MPAPATVHIRGEDGTPKKVPLSTYQNDPAAFTSSRACPTFKVKYKGAKAGAETYVINQTDFDASKHEKV